MACSYGRITQWAKNHIWQIVTFVILFLSTLIFQKIHNITEYIGDAKYYWIAGDAVIFPSGKLNLMLFPETFRGYLFPSLLSVMKFIAQSHQVETVIVWRVFVSLIVPLLFIIALPRLFSCSIITPAKTVRLVLMYALFLWIWRDFVLYPLSDLLATLLLILALGSFKGLSQMIKQDNKPSESLSSEQGISVKQRSQNKIKKNLEFMLGGYLTGLLIYAAYNTRVVYGYALLIALSIFIIQIRKRILKSTGRITVLFLLLGMVTLALPQCAINKQYVGGFSPRIYTEKLYDYSHDLQSQQILWGIQVSRYECYVGDPSIYPNGGLLFDDVTGREILKKENIDISNFNYPVFVKLFFNYPLDMMSIYIRHIVSLMTPALEGAYTAHLRTDRSALGILSFAIWFISLIAIITEKENIIISEAIWILIAIIPCILQMPGAPEVRFIMPMYMLAYFYVFICVDYKKLWNVQRKRAVPIVLCGIVIFSLWMTIHSDTLMRLRNANLLLNDKADTIEMEIGNQVP